MRILLDTHVFPWWITDSNKLSQKAFSTISDGSNSVYLSAASCWEIAIKERIGKITLPDKAEKFFADNLSINSFISLQVNIPHALNTINLPGIHKDPFDRMLVSQAQLEGMTLLSNDSALARYNIELIW